MKDYILNTTLKCQKKLFGNHMGEDIFLFTLSNGKGMEVSITNLGATITSIKTMDKFGEFQETVCGFDTLEDYTDTKYLENYPYFGATIGRYPGRIKGGCFTLNEKKYQLPQNDGNNTLHGGNTGFDKKVWKVTAISEDPKKVSLTMAAEDKHLEQGFPGNVKISVTFSLNLCNELKLSYSAQSDEDTPFSITNHTYFNLSGFDTMVENHTLQVNANTLQEWDEASVGTNKTVELEGLPQDCRFPIMIGTIHNKLGRGLDDCFSFGDHTNRLEHIATVACEASGRVLEIYTTEPTMVFYTGSGISNQLRRDSGECYGKFMGFCCETQRYPNGPNIGKESSILRNGEQFESTTIFKFK